MDILIDDYIKYVKNELWTLAINKCIKENKGNRIIFSKNKIYKSGTIYLENDTHLYFEKNAKLIASDNIDDFNVNNKKINNLEVNTFINCDYDGKPYLYFIYGYNLNNITIDGEGYIDGNEKIFYGQVEEDFIEGAFYPRMPLIYLEATNNITFNKITLQNSAFWTVHLVGCHHILIDNIKILNNRKMLNSDGIDPDHSSDILIKDSIIETADDCIVFKSTKEFIKYGPTHDIKVFNCKLKSTCAAIKFGTESYSDFYNIEIDNVEINDTNRGISIQNRDGAIIHDVKFNNINIITHQVNEKAFWGNGEGISITNIKRNPDSVKGLVSNLEFNNINIDGEHGLLLYGDIENIIFNNLNIKISKKTEYDRRRYDLRPTYLNNIYDDISAIYLNECKNIIFNKTKIESDYKDIIESDSTYKFL